MISSSGNLPDNLNITFGHLGSYIYNKPILLPSPPQNIPAPQKTASKDTSYVYKLSKDQCREALKKWVDSQCCKGSHAVKEGHIGDTWTYNALEVIHIYIIIF